MVSILGSYYYKVDLKKALGKDLLFRDDDLYIDKNGDLGIVEGINCFGQDIAHRLETATGELLGYPEYGAGTQSFIGMANTDANRFLLAQLIKRNVELDRRVQNVTVNVTTQNTSSLQINIEVTFVGEPNPFSKIFNVTINSVEEIWE